MENMLQIQVEFKEPKLVKKKIGRQKEQIDIA